MPKTSVCTEEQFDLARVDPDYRAGLHGEAPPTPKYGTPGELVSLTKCQRDVREPGPVPSIVRGREAACIGIAMIA